MGQGDAKRTEDLLAGGVVVGAQVGFDERVPVGGFGYGGRDRGGEYLGVDDAFPHSRGWGFPRGQYSRAHNDGLAGPTCTG